ncbi:hypothetical protein IQ13_3581 [Lacibacter cauensis]|uniref:Uncharacterized protein n=1 Tax=Lacibacter cauensis TaxID=510947 RepID=A0A562SCX8_9BACT|nr:hypothetical protein [Lacibacter cauensis]TWI79179.1 hypothetical protein IQ13_3581 [Lacibacter cauensis]
MNTLLGVLGTQELIIILSIVLSLGLFIIIPVIIAYRLGKKAGKLEAMEMQRK